MSYQNRLREERLKALMTQQELAKKAGVSTPVIISLETNGVSKHTGRTLMKVAEALGKSADYLFFDPDV